MIAQRGRDPKQFDLEELAAAAVPGLGPVPLATLATLLLSFGFAGLAMRRQR